MPYVLISTQIRMEIGPTVVGDEFSDPQLMEQIGATRRTVLGNNFAEYYVSDPPRVTLNKLEMLGYRVISMTGVGQTLVHSTRAMINNCSLARPTIHILTLPDLYQKQARANNDVGRLGEEPESC